MAGNVKLMQLACKFISKTGNPASVCCRLGRIIFIFIDFFVFLQMENSKNEKTPQQPATPFPRRTPRKAGRQKLFPEFKNFYLLI